MDIVKKSDAPLLNRTEYIINIDHSNKSTPSKDTIKKDLAGFLKTNENLISVKHIYTDYGSGKSNIIVNVYQKEEDLKKIEIKNKKVKEKKETQEQAKPESKKVEKAVKI